MLFFLFISLVLAATTPTSPFNGAWQLDVTREAGSSDAMLQLIGLGSVQRNIIRSLNVVERYEVTATTLKLVRDTLYTHNDDTYHLGVEEQVQDILLGPCKQTVTVAVGGRMLTSITRPDGSQFSGVRKIQSPQQFTNTMNFTTPDGRHASCVRYYTRINTVLSIRERVGRLNPVKPV